MSPPLATPPSSVSRATKGDERRSSTPAFATSDAPLFRFGLRQLLWFFVPASLLFAVMAISPAGTAFLLLLMTAISALHVLATAIGHHLRDRSDQQHAFESFERIRTESVASIAERSERLAAVRCGARSAWHSRGGIVLPWLTQVVVVTAVVGGIVGATYLAVAIGDHASPAGVIVGGISVAVVCGWITFLAASFYGVFRHGFREALTEQQKDSP